MTEQLWALHTDNRPTEWQAVFLMLAGWIPVAPIGESLDRVMYFAPRRHNGQADTDQRSVLTDSWLGQTTAEQERLVKVCNNCGEEYLLTEEFWHEDPNSPDGYHSLCRGCRNRHGRKYYQRRKRRAVVNRR